MPTIAKEEPLKCGFFVSILPKKNNKAANSFHLLLHPGHQPGFFMPIWIQNEKCKM